MSPNTPTPPRRLDLCLPVVTTARSLWSLINNFDSSIAASIGTQVAYVYYQAAKANTVDILIGGVNLNTGVSPTRQCGKELSAGQGFSEPVIDGYKIDLSAIYAATATATQYLCISIVF